MGDCRRIETGDGRLTSPNEADMTALEDVVARYLVGIALREDLTVERRSS